MQYLLKYLYREVKTQMNNKRYLLQKLIEKEEKIKLEVWINTPISSDKLSPLMNFLSVGHRIFDVVTGRVVKRR